MKESSAFHAAMAQLLLPMGMLRHPDDAAVLQDLLERNQAVAGQPLVHIGIDCAGALIIRTITSRNSKT